MKYLVWILCLLLCVSSIVHAQSARISGTVYDNSFVPVDFVVLKINTTPEQVRLAQTGSYQFLVPNGSYHIAAFMTRNGFTHEIASDEIIVNSDGLFVKDLFMSPDFDPNVAFAINASNVSTKTPRTYSFIEEHQTIILIWIIGFVIAIALVYGYFLFKRKPAPIIAVVPPTQVSQENSATVIETLSSDDKSKLKILELIVAHNGQYSQKLLAKEFGVSEAKISLLVSQLVAEEKLIKVKAGRSNMLKINPAKVSSN